MQKNVVLVLDNDRDFVDRRIQHQIDALSEKYQVFFIRESYLKEACISEGQNCKVINITDTTSNKPIAPLHKPVTRGIYYFTPIEDPVFKRLALSKYYIVYLPLIIIYLLLNAHTAFSFLFYKLKIKKPIHKQLLSVVVYSFLLRFDVILSFLTVFLARKLSGPAKLEKRLSSKVDEIKIALVDVPEPKIIHVHDLPSLELGILLKNEFSAKLIYDSHEIYPEQFSYDKKRYNFEYKREHKLISKIDYLISVNSYCVDRIKELHDIKVDATAISNSVKIDNLDAADSAKYNRIWHEKHKLSDGDIIAVFQGGINAVRNIDEWVTSLTLLPEHIHIGFITFAKDITYYKELCDKLGISHRVHFEIELDWPEVIECLKAADFGFIPYQNSSNNAFAATPNKMYEFLVANLPIIAGTNLPQVAKFVSQNNIGYLFELNNSQSYADAFMNAIEWKKYSGTGLQKAFKIANEKYSYAIEQEKLFGIYEKLI